MIISYINECNLANKHNDVNIMQNDILLLEASSNNFIKGCDDLLLIYESMNIPKTITNILNESLIGNIFQKIIDTIKSLFKKILEILQNIFKNRNDTSSKSTKSSSTDIQNTNVQSNINIDKYIFIGHDWRIRGDYTEEASNSARNICKEMQYYIEKANLLSSKLIKNISQTIMRDDVLSNISELYKKWLINKTDTILCFHTDNIDKVKSKIQSSFFDIDEIETMQKPLSYIETSKEVINKFEKKDTMTQFSNTIVKLYDEAIKTATDVKDDSEKIVSRILNNMYIDDTAKHNANILLKISKEALNKLVKTLSDYNIVISEILRYKKMQYIEHKDNLKAHIDKYGKHK